MNPGTNKGIISGSCESSIMTNINYKRGVHESYTIWDVDLFEKRHVTPVLKSNG